MNKILLVKRERFDGFFLQSKLMLHFISVIIFFQIEREMCTIRLMTALLVWTLWLRHQQNLTIFLINIFLPSLFVKILWLALSHNECMAYSLIRTRDAVPGTRAKDLGARTKQTFAQNQSVFFLHKTQLNTQTEKYRSSCLRMFFTMAVLIQENSGIRYAMKFHQDF